MNYVPYLEIDGCWTVSDTHIKEYYQKLDKDNFFYIDPLNEAEFIRYCKSPENHVVIFKGGIALINDINEGHCIGHINFWANAITHGNEFLNHIFNLKIDGQHLINVILGYTPTWNKRAIAYLKKLNFEEIGTIPNYATTNKGVSDFLLTCKVNKWASQKIR